MAARVKFQNPPINELVVGVYFVPIPELKAQHIGRYWQRVSDRYPQCEQQPPVNFTMQEFPGEVFPLPRFWFFGDPHSMLVQVQRDAFLFNWRRGDGNQYPHYESVVSEFWEELNEFKQFLKETVDGKIEIVNRCELTYVNLIDKSSVSSDSSWVGQVLPPMAALYSLESSERSLSTVNTTVTFKITDTLTIDASVKMGTRIATQEPVLQFELRAGGAPEDLTIKGARAWFDAAHTAIGDLFLRFTDKSVQRDLWKPL